MGYGQQTRSRVIVQSAPRTCSAISSRGQARPLRPLRIFLGTIPAKLGPILCEQALKAIVKDCMMSGEVRQILASRPVPGRGALVDCVGRSPCQDRRQRLKLRFQPGHYWGGRAHISRSSPPVAFPAGCASGVSGASPTVRIRMSRQNRWARQTTTRFKAFRLIVVVQAGRRDAAALLARTRPTARRAPP